MGTMHDRDELIREVASLKQRGGKIVFTNGCFDILHYGHVRCLAEAKALGDILIVAVNSDASVRRLKGKNRPINSEEHRAYVVASLSAVDYVTIFNEDTPYELIRSIMPHVLVKGGDWPKEQVVGGSLVEEAGGAVVIIPEEKGFSTTRTIEKIRSDPSKP